ncbi:Sensor histidine kinase YpdA [Kordia antarctica]|uniref:Sensor histidine kinase YpdA n=1 Tax=Kordia antarctica TaxID=1218801 RepID=A0A7L4ZP72_9FLAO|nr:histidine kinase [Kordia antarctica]QHI38538.1 Sensor histidine kinase YpdA [Kordia antarctica]
MRVIILNTLIKKLHFLFILLFATVAFGQHPIYTQFSEKDGLPDIEFYNMTEDSKGFIWLAANKGFYRYDGNQFKIYTNKEKRGLSVFEPKEDSKGRVWCCNISGQFFYAENDELITFIDLEKEINGRLGSFIVTDKHLLVFTYQTIYKISLKTREIDTRIQIGNPLIGSPYRYGNEIYVTTGESIVTLDLELNITKKITSEAIYDDLSKRSIGSPLITGSKGKTYLKFMDRNSQSYLYLFDLNSGQYEEIELEAALKNSNIAAISFYNDEMLFSSSSGLWVYSMEGGNLVYKNRYFKNEYVSKVVVDRNENYWVTTLRNGVFVIPNINNNNYNLQDGIEGFKYIEKINEASFFFGTATGDAGFYNIETNKISLIDLKKNTPVQAAFYNKSNKKMYISQQDQGVIYDFETKTITTNRDFFNARSISYINKNTFLLANYQGASVVENGKVDSRLKFLRAYIGFHDTISKNSYVSYVDDLVKYDSKFNAKIIRYQGKKIHSVSITKTDDGTIWVSTFKDGLYGIKNDSVVVNYTTENGLASNFTQKIKGDRNSLWIVTNKGIQLLNTKTETFKILTKGDGISTYLINGIIPFKDNVIFSTNKGIFSIDRKTAFQQRVKPEIYFTGIQISEKDTLLQEKYTLPHSQNAIKLSFNSNGFRSKEHIRYYSRLLGFNENWIPVDEGIDFVKYNSLPVGNYTFQVLAESTSLARKSEIAAIEIAIESPFWKRPWFVISSVLSALLFIILYYRNILKKRDKQKNKELEKLAQERELVFLKLENLRSQMNPHFIFNALNSIQEYIILNKKNLASDYLGKFADLIRTYLNHSNKGAISLQDEIDCLEMYLELEELRFEDKLSYTFHIDENIDTESLSIPTMLIQPYVENALKHGLLHKKDNRLLSISLQTVPKKNAIICTIEDNGIGREKALELKIKKDKMHKSFGTQATQDRLDLLNYGKGKRIGVSIEDLYDAHTKEPSGTKVVITIPATNITASSNYTTQES